MTLDLKEVTENVYHITTKTQYELASTFMRVQEFYESPFKEIRGHFFTHEEYMDTHSFNSERSDKEEIEFTYLTDWAGFNVPGNVFNKWLNMFAKNELWKKEQDLVDLIRKQNKSSSTNKFYVIGTYTDGDSKSVDHELSHAWYYLKPEYKKASLKLVNTLSTKVRSHLKEYLIKEGYTTSVINDEIVAYLSTNNMTYTEKMFKGTRTPWSKILSFQQNFEDFKDEYIDKTD